MAKACDMSVMSLAVTNCATQFAVVCQTIDFSTDVCPEADFYNTSFRRRSQKGTESLLQFCFVCFLYNVILIDTFVDLLVEYFMRDAVLLTRIRCAIFRHLFVPFGVEEICVSPVLRTGASSLV